MENLNDHSQEVKITLGSRLRQLTEAARSKIELENFIKVLEDTANAGENKLYFEDLRDYLPNMINAGTAYQWLNDNEIYVSGQVDPDTAKHSMTISW